MLKKDKKHINLVTKLIKVILKNAKKKYKT